MCFLICSSGMNDPSSFFFHAANESILFLEKIDVKHGFYTHEKNNQSLCFTKKFTAKK